MVQRFRDLADAYDVLSDPEARQKYDASGAYHAGSTNWGRRWRPGDGCSAEEMEGHNTRWATVLRERKVLQQAREEYVQDLRQDLKRAFEPALQGDLSGVLDFVKRYPGVTAAAVLVVLPVIVVVRSPAAVAMVLNRLMSVNAILTKAWVSTSLSFLFVANSSIPERIWKARVEGARRAIEMRKARREADTRDGSEGFKSTTIISDPALKEALVVSAAIRSGLPAATSIVPNLVYLDDSSSMVQYWTHLESQFTLGQKFRWDQTCLRAGQTEFIDLATYLEGTPVRVVKFGGVTEFEDYKDHRGVLSLRKVEKMLRTLLLETDHFQNGLHLPPLLKSWDGSSQGTFMWKMMETDILGTYSAEVPIRVHLLTDGLDTHSPGEFRGIRGMEALKASLRDKGYRIQWNIILLLYGVHGVPGLAADAYQELCRSSGGVFQVISDRHVNSRADADLQYLLDRHDTEQARQQMKELLIAARSGTGDDVHLPLLASGPPGVRSK